jgi:hypothetical protein
MGDSNIQQAVEKQTVKWAIKHTERVKEIHTDI